MIFVLFGAILVFSYVYSQDEVPVRLVVTIQQGKQVNNRQSFQVNSGEAVFIPIGRANLNVPTVPKPSPQELAYQNDRGNLSQQISNKIEDLQAKQAAYDNETYLVYKAPLELDRQRLISELRDLEGQRGKIEGRKIFADAQKTKAEALMPEPPSSVPQGMYVKPTIKEGGEGVSLNVRTQGINPTGKGEINSTIDIPFGQWLQIPNQDVWLKVDKGG